MASGMYDDYKNTKVGKGDNNLYSDAYNGILGFLITAYRLVVRLAIYCSAFAIIVSAILLVVASLNGPKAIVEAKEHIRRVLLVSVLVFMASGIVNWVNYLGL